ADRRDPLARGIGREKEPMRARGDADSEVRHARLDDGDTRDGIDFDDPAQASCRDDYRARAGDRAAGEPRAGAARHDRYARIASGAHDRDDVLVGARDRDRRWRMPIESRVVLPHQKVGGSPEHVLRPTYLFEPTDERTRDRSRHGQGRRGVARGSEVARAWRVPWAAAA